MKEQKTHKEKWLTAINDQLDRMYARKHGKLTIHVREVKGKIKSIVYPEDSIILDEDHY